MNPMHQLQGARAVCAPIWVRVTGLRMNSWEHDTFVVGGSDEAAAHTVVQVAQAA